MPSLNNYLTLLYVNLGFLAQIAVIMYFKSATEIKQNWVQYRCNPAYWIFSDNIAEDFSYCVQSTQSNMMGNLLQPLNYMISSLTSINGDLGSSMNDMRNMFSSVRGFISNIIENVFAVFLNLIIEFQKMIISIKDMVAKMIGVVVTIMYILDGSIKTMNSAWSGPPGQMVKAIGSCFHPSTKITLANGDIYSMDSVPLGSTLSDGSKVFAVLKIDNVKQEPLYKINGTISNNFEPIYVTGEHYVLDKKDGQWKQINQYWKARKTDIVIPSFACLITTNRRIVIKDETFWDWEDDELNM